MAGVSQSLLYRACVLAIISLLAGVALGQSRVDYGDRGNRFEGVVRGYPVHGYTMELLSARAIYRQPPQAPGSSPPFYRLRFYLEQTANAFVVVREVHNRHFYWLDKVKPTRPWGKGFDNVFEWPTADVIRQLPGLQLDDLGVIVRIGHAEPSDLEKVAPAILYSAVPPATISEYEFAFKTNVTAQLSFGIEGNDGSPVSPDPQPHFLNEWPHQIPLRVTWNATGAQPGVYRLVVKGMVLRNNDRFGKEVRFFHKPTVSE